METSKQSYYDDHGSPFPVLYSSGVGNHYFESLKGRDAQRDFVRVIGTLRSGVRTQIDQSFAKDERIFHLQDLMTEKEQALHKSYELLQSQELHIQNLRRELQWYKEQLTQAQCLSASRTKEVSIKLQSSSLGIIHRVKIMVKQKVRAVVLKLMKYALARPWMTGLALAGLQLFPGLKSRLQGLASRNGLMPSGR